MMVFHDSRNEMYRWPLGAVCCGERITLRVCAKEASSVTLRLWWNDAEQRYPMKSIAQGLYACDVEMPQTPGVMWYYFCIVDESGESGYYGNAEDGLGGVGRLSACEPASYQITVYDRAYQTPEWMRNGTMMQIMVDRFFPSKEPDERNLPRGSFYHRRWEEPPILVCNDRSGEYAANDYFGGDLRGVEEKLDYLQQLGITILYLNPIFRANSNHKYNTGDYMQIDPAFGTEEDFRSLCASAQKRGMRVILDGVFSHTGSDSVYFNKNGTYGEGGAYNDPQSPYADWYEFKNWPDDYECWWGFKTLPNVDEMNPKYRQFIISDEDSVIAHWMKAGAAGWRLDVADELPMDFLRELRQREKGIHSDAALIGEVWEDPSNKVTYGETRCYCLGDTLDSTMNYPLRDAVLAFMRGQMAAPEFVRRIHSMQENLPKPFFYSEMNLLGSHDKPRALTILADVESLEPERCFRRALQLTDAQYAKGKRRLMAAWCLICALPGMPCVYYGDEAGLYGMSDPFCRGTYPWGREDQELIEAFRDAMQCRTDSTALRTGTLDLTAIGDDVVLVRREIAHGEDVFGQAAANESVCLAVNRADASRQIEIDGKTIEIPAESAVWL